MTTERRRYARSNLRLPLFLFPIGSAVPLRTQTENVGLDGLFCYTQHLFSPGDRLGAFLFLPAADGQSQAPRGMCLHAEVQIIRVTIGPLHSHYGIGCRLNGYRVLPQPDLHTLETVLGTVLEAGCV